MSAADHMARRINLSVRALQDGVQPNSLASWYLLILSQARRMAPPWLADKINVIQDPILPMRFKLDISRRAIKYFVMALDSNIDLMPQSTKMYFLRVQESLEAEVDSSLV